MRIALGRLAACLIILLLLPLAGCFDYDVELTLHETGAGDLLIDVNMPQQYGGEDQIERMANIVLPLPQRQSKVEAGRLHLSETCKFNLLSELAVHRTRFDLLVIEKGLAGLTDYTYRLTTIFSPLEGDLPDRQVLPGQELEVRKEATPAQSGAASRAQKLLARTLQGHFVSLTLNLPGRVVKPYPLAVGDDVVQPELSNRKSTITWRVPLYMLASQNIRHNLTFIAEFKGEVEFRSSKHEQSASRSPSAADVELATQLRKKAGGK